VLVQRFVLRRCGRRLREVGEVAVQVDAVLVDASQPRETERVDRVHQHHDRVGRKRFVQAIREEADLAPRSAEALGAVRAEISSRPRRAVAGPMTATSTDNAHRTVRDAAAARKH
jgi:hypothetical protein